MDSENGQPSSRTETLAKINRYHLILAGYSSSDIIRFGDLGKLSKTRMHEVICGKSIDDAGKGLKEPGTESKTFRGSDEKR